MSECECDRVCVCVCVCPCVCLLSPHPFMCAWARGRVCMCFRTPTCTHTHPLKPPTQHTKTKKHTLKNTHTPGGCVCAGAPSVRSRGGRRCGASRTRSLPGTLAAFPTGMAGCPFGVCVCACVRALAVCVMCDVWLRVNVRDLFGEHLHRFQQAGSVSVRYLCALMCVGVCLRVRLCVCVCCLLYTSPSPRD